MCIRDRSTGGRKRLLLLERNPSSWGGKLYEHEDKAREADLRTAEHKIAKEDLNGTITP